MSDLESDDDHKEHKQSDPDLAELEDELEDNKPKKENKVIKEEVKPVKKEKDKVTTKVEIKPKDEKKENVQNEKSVVVDIYSERAEQIYHRPDKIKSIGVLQEELKVVDEVILYKKEKGIDYDFFEAKKDLIDVEIQKIENLCSCGAMDIDTYKKVIETELKYENQLIDFANKDKNLSKNELDAVIKRINKRKEVIETELNQEVPEEEDEPEANETKPETEDHKTENRKTEDRKTEEQTVDEKKKESPKSEPKTLETNNNNNKDVKLDTRKKVELDKKLYDDLKARFIEYKSAADYFKKIGSASQEEDAISKAKELFKAMKTMEEGYEIDEFSLPIGVTPDYICGYSQKERLNHFSKIIKEFSVKKNELNENLEKRKEKLKQLDKKDFVKMKDAIKKDLDERMEKIKKYTILLNKIHEMIKNPWIPAPLYSHVEEEERVEVTHEEVEPNFIKIYIGKTTYDQVHAYLIVNLAFGDKVLTETVTMKKNFEYDHIINWKLEKSELMSLPRRHLEIQIWKTK